MAGDHEHAYHHQYVDHAPIDDEGGHTGFYLLTCRCGQADVFPRSNFNLTTPAYQASVTGRLAAEGLWLTRADPPPAPPEVPRLARLLAAPSVFDADITINAKTDVQPDQLQRLQRRLNLLHTGHETVPMEAPRSNALINAHHHIHRTMTVVFTVDVTVTGDLRPSRVQFDGRHYVMVAEQPEGFPECVCRTASCGHVASAHSGPNGQCVICNQECWR